MPVDSLLTFFVASVLLALAPGPDNIFVMTQSALYGRKAGMLVTLGLCTGLLVHSTAVALGVAAVFQASALAFTALKVAGAAYLLYLAWQAFRASAEHIGDGKGANLSDWKLFRRGIIMNVTNPKVSIFFLAFLPQFVVPEQGGVIGQTFTLGALFIVAALLVFGAVVVMAGSLGEWLNRSPKAQLIMNRLAGVIFVGMAIKLVTASVQR